MLHAHCQPQTALTGRKGYVNRPEITLDSFSEQGLGLGHHLLVLVCDDPALTHTHKLGEPFVGLILVLELLVAFCDVEPVLEPEPRLIEIELRSNVSTAGRCR